MAIVKLKTKDQTVSELLRMFNLPQISTKGYQTKQLVGASAAMTNLDAQRLAAVNELRRWMRPSSTR